MATEESANPWIAAGEAVRNRAMRTQDQGAATQDEGSATHDESAAAQDVAVPGDHPLRIARGDMTQQELADASGVSRRRISQIESRIKGASAEIAANLAAALNTTAEALGLARPDRPAPTPSDHPLAAARTAAGLSQTDLARRAGISPSVVSKLEGGKIANPQMEQAHALARALGSNVEALGLIPTGLHPLAHQRWVQGLSQKQLAVAADVSLRAVQRIEEGGTEADRETRQALAAAVGGADADTLFSPPAPAPAPVPAPAPQRVVAAHELVGERLREERKAVGLSQRQLAAAAHVDRSVIGVGETAAGWDPMYGTVRAIGNALVAAGADFVLAPDVDIAWERDRLGVSLEELAEHAGLNHETFTRMEAVGTTSARTSSVVAAHAALSELARTVPPLDPATERVRLGVPRWRLAEASGLSRHRLSEIESGRERLTAESLAAIRAGVARIEGEQIREQRKSLTERGRREVTQQMVAEASGLSQSRLSQIEFGGEGLTAESRAAIRAGFARIEGADLREQRDSLALTRADVAALTGIPADVIAGVESGGTAPNPEVATAVRKVLQEAEPAAPTDLRALREEIGLTQNELSRRSGVPQRTISRVERGAEPTPEIDVALRATLHEAHLAGTVGRALDFDVAQVREVLGMKPGELAARANIAHSTVNDIEAGRRAIGTKEATNAAIRGVLANAVAEALAAPDLNPADMRAWLGISARTLARDAGINREALSRWEAGTTGRPSETTVEAVRGVLADAVLAFFAGQTRQAETRSRGDLFRDRKVADLTVAELAELSGVSAAEIRRIETDPGYQPAEVTMRAIREGFNEADVRRFGDAAPDHGASADMTSDGGSAPSDSRTKTGPTSGAAGADAPVAEGSISVPVGPLTVNVPDAPARPDLPSAPPLPPHLERMGPQAAYFDASMRGFPAGRQAGAEAAARAEVPWGREEGAADGTPVLKVDRGDERLNEARRTASDNDVEADEQVGVDWEAEAPFTAPVGAAAAGQEADALREATFSGTTGAASGLTAAQVHAQRFEQAAWDGFQQGWAQTMAERALLAAQDHSELAAPDVTPDMHAEALAAIGHAPSAAPQASTPAGPEPRAEAAAESGPDVGPEAGSDTGLDAGPEPGSDAGSQAGPETGQGGGPEARPGAGRAAGPGAGPGVGSDAGRDAGPEVGSDAGSQAGPDAGRGGGPEARPGAGRAAGPGAGPEVGSDAGSQAGPEAGRGGGPEARPGAGRAAGPGAGPDVGSDAESEAAREAGADAGPQTGPDAGPQVGPGAGRQVGPNAGSQAGPEAGRGAGREAGPQVAAQPEGASGVSSGARDSESSRETSGPEPVSEPAPKSGPEPAPPTGQSAGAVREAGHQTGPAAGRTGSADAGLAVPASSQSPGPAPGARADPALLGLSAPGARSAAAPERSVDTSVSAPAPAPAPAPEPSPGPALELEQGKEV